MRRIFYASLLLPLFAACVDFDALSGNEDAGTSGDASFDASFDAAIDSAISDSGPDAAIDDLVDASFCAKTDATFCDDFDTVSLAARWNAAVSKGNGDTSQSAFDAAPSPPNTLLATVPFVDASSVIRTAYISHVFSATFTHFELALDLYVVTPPSPSGAMFPLAIYSPMRDSLPGHQLTFAMYAMPRAYAQEIHTFVDGGGFSSNTPSWFSAPQIGVWQHLDLAIDLSPDAGPAQLTVSLDGTVVQSAALSTLWTLGPTVEVELGIESTYQSQLEWDVRYDNVVVNAY